MKVIIKHKFLRRFADTGDVRGIPSELINKIERILTLLNVSTSLEQINLPEYKMHKLKGKLKDYYSLKVNANWRIIFQFDGKELYNVDLIDYH